MLVLSRKKGEAILIGENIELKIISIEGDQIKLGIRAPSSVEVFRKELYESIQNENNEAANAPLELLPLLQQKKENKDDF
ncbi:carbon storage regulator CsrA [Virgibacillus sp. W0430]|uniref:carbon storage regulator CsrA n=1 Tax=Virgibacillus sp. W0430 TaxID=3391580 RepID=UPI003F48FF6A